MRQFSFFIFILIVQAFPVYASQSVATTKDYASCSDHMDIPICLLRVVSRESITPFKLYPEYAARPELLELIEGANGENVRVFDEEDGYFIRAIRPSLLMRESVLEALQLDSEGAEPEESIALLLSGHPTYRRDSLYSGQIELSSSAQNRILAYWIIFDVARKAQDDKKLISPSREFLSMVAEAWRTELQSPEFEEELPRLYAPLAKAYAFINEYENAVRLYADSSAFLRASLEVWFENPRSAWDIIRAECNSSFEAGRLSSAVIDDILEIADEELRNSIIEFFIDEVPPSYGLDQNIVWRFFDDNQAKALTDKILQQEAQPRANGLLALALVRANRQDELNVLVNEWKAKARLQPGGPCNSQVQECPKNDLRFTLASLSRLDEAIGILDNSRPHDLFRDELTLGRGLPSTFDEMIDADYLVAPTLGSCVDARAMLPVSNTAYKYDMNSALICARNLIEYSKSPDQLGAEANRLEQAQRYLKPEAKPTAYVGIGRYYAAETIVKFAYSVASRGEWELAEEMLDSTFELWLEAPEAKGPSTYHITSLAEMMLKRDGRF